MEPYKFNDLLENLCKHHYSRMKIFPPHLPIPIRKLPPFSEALDLHLNMKKETLEVFNRQIKEAEVVNIVNLRIGF